MDGRVKPVLFQKGFLSARLILNNVSVLCHLPRIDLGYGSSEVLGLTCLDRAANFTFNQTKVLKVLNALNTPYIGLGV
jgi:hypothetical protein